MPSSAPLPIALELYTVRDEVARDMAGTLRRVADLGFDGVEFAGYGGLTAEQMRDLLAETGLRTAGTHVGLDRLQADFDREVAYCKTIGCDELVLPWLPEGMRGSDSVDELIGILNDFGARCSDAGLRFGYHNHNFEFAQTDGKTLWQRMVEGTDPDRVFFEMDVYWVAYAGFDPRELLRTYRGRIPFVHFKDMGPDGKYTEVGSGSLRLDDLYREGPDLDIEWAIVELDQPQIPSLQSAEQSLQVLLAARGER